MAHLYEKTLSNKAQPVQTIDWAVGLCSWHHLMNETLSNDQRRKTRTVTVKTRLLKFVDKVNQWSAIIFPVRERDINHIPITASCFVIKSKTQKA